MVDTSGRKFAFLFPGQGAQHKGMAIDLLEADADGSVKLLFEAASAIMGQDMKKLLGESEADILKITSIAQPAITLANLAACAALGVRGIKPAACAGHSLGEYAALCAAGVIGSETCFELVKARGAFMQKAAENLGGVSSPMAAVLGLSAEKVAELVQKWRLEGLCDLYVANYNSSRQTVVSGAPHALQKAEALFKEAGARRFMPLNVAGPFHSPLMAEAESAFAAVLGKVEFAEPVVPVFSNVSGAAVKNAAHAKELLLLQITSPVRWTSEEAAIASLGVDAALEAGPGKVLSGLWEQEISGIKCYPAGNSENIKSIVL